MNLRLGSSLSVERSQMSNIGTHGRHVPMKGHSAQGVRPASLAISLRPENAAHIRCNAHGARMEAIQSLMFLGGSTNDEADGDAPCVSSLGQKDRPRSEVVPGSVERGHPLE